MALHSAVSAGRWPELGPPAVLRDNGRNPVPLLNDVRPGVRDVPGAIILTDARALLQKPAGAPLATAPAAGPRHGRKWSAAVAASCVFHAAVAAFLLVGAGTSVLIEGADHAGSVMLGNASDDELASGEPAAQPDVTQVTLITMLEAQPIATVDAEAVAIGTAEAVPVTTPATEVIEAETAETVEPVRAAAAQPVVSEPVRPAPETRLAPELLTAESIDPAEDNTVAPQTETLSAERAPAADAAAPAPSPVLTPVEEAPVSTARPAQVAEPLQPEDAREVSPDMIAAEEIEPSQAQPSDVQTIVAEEEASQDLALPEIAPRPEPRRPEPERRTAETDKPEPKRAEAKPARQKKAEAARKEAASASAVGAKGNGRTNARKGVATGDRDGRTAAKSNGGKSGAGNAAVSNYPGKVAAKLRRAARSISRSAARKAKNDVQVGFTVKADGSIGGIRITRSSGSPDLDQAALAVVRRAAPFPPIPEAAGRSSWAFALPLGVAR